MGKNDTLPQKMENGGLRAPEPDIQDSIFILFHFRKRAFISIRTDFISHLFSAIKSS